MKITVLTENQAGKRGMLAEHGLSVWLEIGEKKILLDTGQSDVYVRNAEKLGVDLAQTDVIVLSHGHYDHCGGLAFFSGELPTVIAREGFLEEKYARNPNNQQYRRIGVDWKPDRLHFRKEGKGLQVVKGEEGETQEIFPGIYTVSGMTRWEEWEGVSEHFQVCREGIFQRDRMQDEQLLVVRENGKLHLFAGCCHAGIISCLNRVRQQFPEEPFGVIMAGMHLKGCGEERLARTVEALRQLPFDLLVPVHCTGMLAIAQLKLAFGAKCMLAETGKVWETGLAQEGRGQGR